VGIREWMQKCAVQKVLDLNEKRDDAKDIGHQVSCL
jgi:hypothetical protein